eukprot:scaffold708_cov248-Pinguiococcus_pyrenoidosus.AAC.1
MASESHAMKSGSVLYRPYDRVKPPSGTTWSQEVCKDESLHEASSWSQTAASTITPGAGTSPAWTWTSTSVKNGITSV